MKNYFDLYRNAIFNMEREKANELVHQALDDGFTPEDIVEKIVIPAMESLITAISEHSENNLAQHYMAAQISSEITDEMIKRFTLKKESHGLVVIGTASGDLHTLGKKIVMGCLHARMINFKDLGVNVAPEKFIDEAIRNEAQVIAISAMMVHTAKGKNGPSRVHELLIQNNLNSRIKLIVGGAPFRFDPTLWNTVGADDWAEDGVTAAKKIENLIKAVNNESTLSSASNY